MKNQQRRLRNADEKKENNKRRSLEHQEIKDFYEKLNDLPHQILLLGRVRCRLRTEAAMWTSFGDLEDSGLGEILRTKSWLE